MASIRPVALVLLAALCLAPLTVPASVGQIAGPDLPMRRSAWLDQAMDSKTCPIVRVRPAATLRGEGERERDAVMATVWRANGDDNASLDAWPALFLSLRGQPLTLRRSDGDFAVEARTVQGQRGTDLEWEAPAERVSVHLRLQPPRQFVEDGDGGWTPLSPGQTPGDEDVSTRTVWRGAMTMQIGYDMWARDVEVESICGP
ncbi:hypothetical protein [Lysobacter sp. Root690]|uniref:hypothetical protein n=1 Tax=Lysobacter sp. Root690 TaxID=1736588 RepID=UPI0006F52BFE|nr:hypothetical protein [Lysobacter sp. Root690]KRB06150.1 hypothetical protein ASD86_15330 [Lysobacter sp. Root690]